MGHRTPRSRVLSVAWGWAEGRHASAAIVPLAPATATGARRRLGSGAAGELQHHDAALRGPSTRVGTRDGARRAVRGHPARGHVDLEAGPVQLAGGPLLAVALDVRDA